MNKLTKLFLYIFAKLCWIYKCYVALISGFGYCREYVGNLGVQIPNCNSIVKNVPGISEASESKPILIKENLCSHDKSVCNLAIVLLKSAFGPIGPSGQSLTWFL